MDPANAIPGGRRRWAKNAPDAASVAGVLRNMDLNVQSVAPTPAKPSASENVYNTNRPTPASPPSSSSSVFVNREMEEVDADLQRLDAELALLAASPSSQAEKRSAAHALYASALSPYRDASDENNVATAHAPVGTQLGAMESEDVSVAGDEPLTDRPGQQLEMSPDENEELRAMLDLDDSTAEDADNGETQGDGATTDEASVGVASPFGTASAPHLPAAALPLKAMAFSIDLDDSAPQMSSDNTAEHEVPTMLLKEFGGMTILEFGRVHVGSSCSRPLHVRNPGLTDLEVSIERFPKDKGFSITWDDDNDCSDGDVDAIRFNVEANSVTTISMTWTPPSAEQSKSLCMTIAFSAGGRRFQLRLIGVAYVPSPKKLYKATPMPASSRSGFKPKRVGSIRKEATPNLSVSPQSGRIRNKAALTALRKQHVAQQQLKDEATSQAEEKPKAFLRAKSRSLIRKVKQASDASEGPSSRLELKRLMKKVSSTASLRNVNASNNTLYDDSWMEKQERAFVCWINHILMPPAAEGRLARFEQLRKFHHARQLASRLFQSKEIQGPLKKVYVEIEEGRLAVRDDRAPWADVGLREHLVSTLMSFSDNWLRLGLETLFGEVLCSDDDFNVTSSALADTVLKRILFDASLAARFASPNSPHLYTEGFEAALKKHTLRRYVALVFFLDRAKKANILPGAEPLFRINASCKRSRDVLATLGRETLKGEGDVVKHLAYFGVAVSHEQQELEEFDFTVSNLSIDLRDGVRLARVVQLLQAGHAATVTDLTNLRIPAVSRLQKKHNVDLTISQLRDAGAFFPSSAAQNVVDGHREVTHEVLWRLLLHFQVNVSVSVGRLAAEIALVKRRSDYSKNSSLRRASDAQMYINAPNISALLQWCRAVGLCHGVQVCDFTVSFSDGRALCSLIHHYHPELLQWSDVRHMTTLTHGENRLLDEDMRHTILTQEDGYAASFSPGTGALGGRTRQTLLSNEKYNFKLVANAVKEIGGVPLMTRSQDMVGTMPEEKVVIAYVSYLCKRLLDIDSDARATLVVQRAWRAHRQRKMLQKALSTAAQEARAAKQAEIKRRTGAATIIQAMTRGYIQRKHLVRQQAAATVLQAAVRGRQARIQASHMKQARQTKMMTAAVITLQAAWRGTVSRRTAAIMREKKQKVAAAIIVQAAYRRWIDHKETQKLRMEQAAIVLQAARRGAVARRAFTARRTAVMAALGCLQPAVRGWVAGRRVQKEYATLRATCIALQRQWRQIRATKRERAAIVIQTSWRGAVACQRYISARRAAVALQAFTRGYLVRRALGAQLTAAITVQRFARGHMARQFCKALRAEAAAKAEEEVRQTAAAIVFQSTWRRRCAMVLRRQLYAKAQRDRVAATRLQAAWRGYMARRRACALRKAYAEEMERRCSAAIILQAAWRGCAARTTYRQLLCLRKQAALCIQCAVRCWQARNQLFSLRALAAAAASSRQMEFAALTLQRAARCWLARCRLRELRHQAAREAQRQQVAATAIQSAIRGWLAKCSSRRLRQQAALETQRRICAATAIQSAIRGWLAQRHVAQLRYQAAQEAQRRASAVTVMQAAVRGWLARRLFAYLQEAAQQQRHQQEKETAALLLQRVVRGCLARQEASKRQHSALVLTRWARATLLSRRAQRVARQRHWAIVVLQRHARAMLTMRAARTELAFLREQQRRSIYVSRWARCAQQSLAAVTLQRAWRRTIAARASSAEIRAALRLQAIARGFLARSHVSAALQAARQARRDRAAIKLQAAFRAHRTRSTMSRRLKEIHRKVMIINAGVEEHMKLGNRATSALEILLNHKQLSFVLRAVRNLDAVTRWSRGCCLRLVEHGAVHILFELIRSCNRSKPHMAVLVHSVQILVHLASQSCTRDAVFHTADCLSVATDLMQMYRDKPEIMAPTAWLLSIASTHEVCRSAFLAKEQAFKRLKSAVLLMERKASVSKPVAVIKGRRPGEKKPTPVELVRQALERLEAK